MKKYLYSFAALAALAVCTQAFAITPIAYGGLFEAFPGTSINTPSVITQATAQYTNAGIDGVSIVYPWNAIETAPDTYTWTAFDFQINAILAAHKKIDVGILGGAFAPSWLYSSPYSVAFTQVVFDAATAGTSCAALTVPATWQANYVVRYNSMMTALAAHLQTIPNAWSNTVGVKLAGIATYDSQLNVDANSATPLSSGCNRTDPTTAWAGFGYKPSLILSAWKSMATNVQCAFVGKEIIQEVTNDATTAFPAIDENSKILPNTPNSTTPVESQIASYVAQTYGNLASIETVALPNNTLSPPVLQARQLGTPFGLSSNTLAANNRSSCSDEGAGCTPITYKQMIDYAIIQGAYYVELQPLDVAAFTQNDIIEEKALAAVCAFKCKK